MQLLVIVFYFFSAAKFYVFVINNKVFSDYTLTSRTTGLTYLPSLFLNTVFQVEMFSEKFKRPDFLPKPARSSVLFATAFGSVMWFWIMFRARQDGPYLLVNINTCLSRFTNFYRDSNLTLAMTKKTKIIK